MSIPLVCDAQKTLLVPVSVQGAPARPFVLDTGSSITVIDDRTAEDRDLAPAGRIASPSGSDSLVSAQLTVGSMVLPASPVATADVRRLSRLLGDVGGILGSDALRAMGRTAIDYARCRLSVGGSKADGEEVRIPLEWHQGRPVITVGGGARLVLDSGATTVTVFSDTAAAGTLRWNSREAAIVRIDRLDGAKIGRLGELECLTVGTMALENVPAVAVRSWYDRRDAKAPDGLLPLGLFSRVHIAYAEGYVELVPASH
ncbi:MAG TPA: aspartyl protease family protein [Vicinamibacterales bacterium]